MSSVAVSLLLDIFEGIQFEARLPANLFIYISNAVCKYVKQLIFELEEMAKLVCTVGMSCHIKLVA